MNVTGGDYGDWHDNDRGGCETMKITDVKMLLLKHLRPPTDRRPWYYYDGPWPSRNFYSRVLDVKKQRAEYDKVFPNDIRTKPTEGDGS